MVASDDLRFEEGAMLVTIAGGSRLHREPLELVAPPDPGPVKRRYRAIADEGRRLILERSCRSCPRRWKRVWKLRTAGIPDATPLVQGRRVYFGSADNRVYGVRRRNGHRVWATDVEGRVLRTLGWWVSPETPENEKEQPPAAVLAIPEPGEELIVLDAAGGSLVLRFQMPGEESLAIGSVVSDSSGRLWLARQGYNPKEAFLMELELSVAPTQDGSNESGYNPTDSAED